MALHLIHGDCINALFPAMSTTPWLATVGAAIKDPPRHKITGLYTEHNSTDHLGECGRAVRLLAFVTLGIRHSQLTARQQDLAADRLSEWTGTFAKFGNKY